jgi:pyruvate dehydrogenase E2 component (dihydrolipoamide acetyltransferase)
MEVNRSAEGADVLRVPEFGADSVLRVLEILATVQAVVQPQDVIATLLLGEYAVEVPAFQSGQVARLVAAAGQLVRSGEPLLELETLSTPAAPATVSAVPPAAPSVEAPTTHDGFGPVVEQPLSRVQRHVGRRLSQAWSSIPQVTHFEEADISDFLRARAVGGGDQPGVLPWLIHACTACLARHPKLNSSLDSDGSKLLLKQYFNIGVAIDTAESLLVATLFAADQMTRTDIARNLADLAARARDGRLRPDEMEGAGFTVSSLGQHGGTGFTPIVNPPGVAILGVSRARTVAKFVGGVAQERTVLPYSLSYDHRVINGMDAARFCSDLRETLEKTARPQ